MNPRLITALVGLGALALTGCSMLASGQAKLGGGGGAPEVPDRPGGAPTIDAPRVEPDEDDPPHVRSALDRLDKMEKLIAARDWASYARESASFQGLLLFQNGYEGEKKRDAIKRRLDALDAAAFETFGGRLHAMVGAGARITEGMDGDAAEAAVHAVDACKNAAATQTTGRGDAITELKKRIAEYRKAAERAQKFDENALRYYGSRPDGSGTVDVPTALLACEANLLAAATQFEDEYEPEVAAQIETEKGCGVIEWLADGVQVGSGKFAAYSRTAGGMSYAERVPCGKLKKKNRYPKALRAAVAELADHLDLKVKDLVVVTDGKPYIEQDDDDYRLHRYQKLIAYSKKFTFSKNPCGGEKVFCEAGGSRSIEAYNRLEHHLDRAAAHAGENPDLCKSHLKQAKERAAWFADFHAGAVKSGSWIKGATYRTKKGATLEEPDLIKSFETKATLADDRLLQKYCNSAPTKTAKKKK